MTDQDETATGRSHTRTSTHHGPDYCAECSEAANEWVPWPCPHSVEGHRPTDVSPPRRAMREVLRSGGRLDKCLTRYDHDRGGRVMEMVAFWPDDTGYEAEASASVISEDDR